MKLASRLICFRKVLLVLMVFWFCSSCTQVKELAPFMSASEDSGKNISQEETSAAVAREPEPQKPVEEAKEFIHTVRWPGESLSLIAKWYTGDGANWRVLAKVNSRLNPNLIRIGDKIYIPDDLLKTKESLPRDFLGRNRSKRRQRSTSTGSIPEPAAGKTAATAQGVPGSSRTSVQAGVVSFSPP
ncbi:MAG: LysM peptidoglycan-binding domain-containing protein [Deltaproteobacteria bacterium]|nr:LysM peptidoglycan-binding domain-containing protein [Deltaproteobacteria bacterium]